MIASRLRELIGRRYESLHQAALILGLSAIISQVLALVRDRIFAHIFGAGATLDIYYAAFKIPDLLFVSVASLVSMSVLIPYFTRELKMSDKAARDFLDSVFTVFITLLVALGGLAYLFMPRLAPLVAPGFSPEALAELVRVSRLLLLSPLFLGLSGHISSVVHSFKRFAIYALSPVLYNLGIILGALLLYPHFGLPGLAMGVVFGAFLHFAVQWPTVKSVGFAPRPRFPIIWSKVREVFLVSIPRTLTLGIHQIIIIFFTAMASSIATGSISVFNFAFNLQSVPLAVIGVSYSMAAFPTLSRLFASGAIKEFGQQVSLAARNIIFWSLPITALFVVLRAQIVRTILGTGAFDWTSTRLTAAALAIFAISVLAQGLVLLFVRGYYASGNTRTPLVINIVSGLTMIGLAYIFTEVLTNSQSFFYFFESLFRVTGISGREIVILMLPLAYSLGIILAALIYLILFSRRFGQENRDIMRTLRHSFYAAVLMGAVAYEALALFDNLFNLETLPGIFMQGLLSGLVSIICGALVLIALQNEEIGSLYATVRKRFWKGGVAYPVSVPGPEEINQG